MIIITNLLILQNKRGGKVMLQRICMPLSEFDHADKGDALYGAFLNYVLYVSWQ